MSIQGGRCQTETGSMNYLFDRPDPTLTRIIMRAEMQPMKKAPIQRMSEPRPE